MLRTVILRNTAAQIATRLISATATMAVAFVIAREFGAYGFGQLTKIFLGVGIFYLVLDAGLNAIFVQDASDDSKLLRRQFSSFLFIRIAWSAVLVILVWILFVLSPIPLFPVGTVERHGIFIASFTLIAQSILVSCNALFQLRLEYHRATIAQIAASLCTIVFLGFILWAIPVQKELLLLGIVGIVTVSSFIAAGVSLWFARPYIVLSAQREFIKKLLKKSWLFAATLIVIAINDQMGRLLLARCCTTADVGVYGLAYKVFEFPLSVPTFFVNSLFPILVAQKRQGRQLGSHIAKAAVFLLVFSVGIGIVLYGIAPLLPFIKTDFNASIVPFRVLLVSLPLFFLTALTMWLLILYEKRKALFFIYTTALLCNTFIGMVVIPIYGSFGAASMVIISEGLVLLLTIGALIFYVRKTTTES